MANINVEERLLGMKAVEKRFISEKQLTECLNAIEIFRPGESLLNIFLEKGYLTRPQIDRLNDTIRKETDIHTPADVVTNTGNKKMFGNIALERNMINEDQLMEALEEQEIYFERGIRVQMGQILLKKQYLTAAQLGMILGAQSTKTLYCKKCKATQVVQNYESFKIYQCQNIVDGEVCGVDLTALKPSQEKKNKPTVNNDNSGGDDLNDIEPLQEITL